MTFAEVMKILLDLNNIKQAQLASYLGYDVSYISKWISGSKVPSVRNNPLLFTQIAQYIANEVNASREKELEDALFEFPRAEHETVNAWILRILLFICDNQPSKNTVPKGSL